MRHSAPTAHARGVLLGSAVRKSEFMRFFVKGTGSFIHNRAILKQHNRQKVKNHEVIVQVFDLFGFFSAKYLIELLKRPIHAGFDRSPSSLSTKLSTKDVSTSPDG
jgi:hypothetical protein